MSVYSTDWKQIGVRWWQSYNLRNEAHTACQGSADGGVNWGSIYDTTAANPASAWYVMVGCASFTNGWLDDTTIYGTI